MSPEEIAQIKAKSFEAFLDGRWLVVHACGSHPEIAKIVVEHPCGDRSVFQVTWEAVKRVQDNPKQVLYL